MTELSSFIDYENTETSTRSVFVPKDNSTVNTDMSDEIAILYQKQMKLNDEHRNQYIGMVERRGNIIPLDKLQGLYQSSLVERESPEGFEKTKAVGRTVFSTVQGAGQFIGSNIAEAVFTDWDEARNRLVNTVKSLKDINSMQDLAEATITGVEQIRKEGFIPDDIVDKESVNIAVAKMTANGEMLTEKLGLKETGYERFGSDLASGFTSMAMIFAAPELILPMIGMSSATDTTTTLMEELDMDYTKAARWGNLAGLTELGSEAVGLHLLVEAMSAKSFIKKGIKSFISESIQEGSQSILGDVIRNAAGMEKEISNIIEDASVNAAVGGIVGSTVSVSHSVKTAKNLKVNQKKLEEGIKQFLDSKTGRKAVNDEAQSALKRLGSLNNYKDGNPNNFIKEWKPKLESGEYQRQMLDIRARVEKSIMEAGSSKEQAVIGGNLIQKLANIAYEESGLIPKEYFDSREFSINQLKEVDKGEITGNFKPATRAINLFKAQNKTTLLHEIGHYVSKEMQYLNTVAIQKRGEGIESYAKLTNWLGKPSKEGFTKLQEEKFANGLVRFLQEGVAPNKTLKGLFNKIAKSFKDIYEKGLSENIELNEAAKELYSDLTNSTSVEELGLEETLNQELKKLRKSPSKVKAETRAEIKELQGGLIDIINNLNLDKAEKGSFITLIKGVNSEKTYLSTRNKVTERAYKYNENKLKTLFNNKIKKLLKSVDKVGAEEAKELKEVKKALTITKKKASYLLENNTDFDPLIEQALLFKSVGIKSADIELIKELYRNIESLKASGKSLYKIKHDKLAKERELIADRAIEQLDKKEKISSKVSKLDMLYGDLNSKLETIGGKQFTDDLNLTLSEVKYRLAHDKTIKQVYSNLQDAYNLSSKDTILQKRKLEEDNVGVLKEVDGKKNEYKYNRLQAIGLYNLMRNEGMEAKLLKRFGNGIYSITSVLSDEDIAFADSMYQYYKDVYKEANDVSIEFTDKVLGKIGSFVPVVSEDARYKEDFNYYHKPKSRPGFFHERKGSDKYLPNVNPIDQLLSYDSQLRYMQNVARNQKRVNDLMENPDVKHRIISKYGEAFYKSFKTSVEYTSLGGIIKNQEQAIKTINKLLGNWVLSKIALNPTVFVKQLPSLAFMGDNIPSKDFYKYLAQGISNPKELLEFSKHPFFVDRFNAGGSDAMAMAMEDSIRRVSKLTLKTHKLTKGKVNLEVIKELTSILQRTGDTGAFVIGGYAKYQYLINEGKMSEDEAMNKVIVDGLQNQQSHTPSNLSTVQQNNNLKAVMLFTNATIQFNKKVDNATKEFARGEITAKQYAKIMFIYRVVAPAIYGAIGTAMSGGVVGMFDDEEEDRSAEAFGKSMAAQIAMSPLKGVVGLNTFAPNLLQAKIQGYGFAPSLPIAGDVWGAMVNHYSGDIDIDYPMLLAAIIEPATGITATSAVRKTRQLKEQF